MSAPQGRRGGSAEVTVVVLTREPCRDLEECLSSVAWAGEVMAVDAGSGESTREILRRHGARIVPQDQTLVRAHGGNFDIARNPAFELAGRRWILVLDADEVVTPGLRDEITAVTAGAEPFAYEIPRRNLYWGRPSRVLGRDHQLRLFPRGSARYAGTQLDRPPEVDLPIRKLSAEIIHRQRDLLRKLRERTDQRARRAVSAGVVPRDGSLSLFWHHLRWYTIRQQAWRDGPHGLALAALYAAYPALEAAKARRIARAGGRR